MFNYNPTFLVIRFDISPHSTCWASGGCAGFIDLLSETPAWPSQLYQMLDHNQVLLCRPYSPPVRVAWARTPAPWLCLASAAGLSTCYESNWVTLSKGFDAFIFLVSCICLSFQCDRSSLCWSHVCFLYEQWGTAHNFVKKPPNDFKCEEQKRWSPHKSTFFITAEPDSKFGSLVVNPAPSIPSSTQGSPLALWFCQTVQLIKHHGSWVYTFYLHWSPVPYGLGFTLFLFELLAH